MQALKVFFQTITQYFRQQRTVKARGLSSDRTLFEYLKDIWWK